MKRVMNERRIAVLGGALLAVGGLIWLWLPGARSPRSRPAPPRVADGPVTLWQRQGEASARSIIVNPPATEYDEDAREDWKVGGPTPDGKCLFVDWRPGDMNGARIYLLSDYGFMLANDGTYKKPKSVYLLGFLKPRRIEVCRTFAQFRRALRRIPRDSTVYFHTTCTSGTASGVSQQTWRQVDRAFRRAGLKYNERNHVIYDICGEGADPLPDAPKELKPEYVRVYGLKAWRTHILPDQSRPEGDTG